MIATATDHNLITATMSVDLSAAFDCVDHRTLVSKLEYYGLDGRTMRWIKSYLSHRSAYVAVGGGESTMKTTLFGVPQGSVLGPILYLIYVNEMTAAIEDENCEDRCHKEYSNLFNEGCKSCGDMPVFADDAVYAIAGRSRMNNQIILEDRFLRIRDYLNANGLQLNETKTSLTKFMTKQKRNRLRGIPPELTVTETVTDRRGNDRQDDRLLSDSKTCRILGLNLQNNLAWEAHLTTGKKPVLSAVRRQLGMIGTIKDKLSFKARLNLVSSLGISKMLYMICQWGNATDNHIAKAQTVQNQAARLVTNLPRTTSKKVLMNACGWLDVRQLTDYHSLVQMWKIIRWKIPGYFSEKVHVEDEGRLSTEAPRLQLTAGGFRWKTVSRWNNLPTYLREENSISWY